MHCDRDEFLQVDAIADLWSKITMIVELHRQNVCSTRIFNEERRS